MGKYFLLTLGIISLVCFFSPQKALAVDINDVAVNSATIIETPDTLTIDPVVIETLPSEAEMTDDSDLLEEATISDPKVIINEIMANAPNDPINHTEIYGLEWVELYNSDITPIDLKGWTLDGKIISTNSLLLQPDDYLIIARDDSLFKKRYSDVACKIVKLEISLSNLSDEVVLSDAANVYNDKFKWTTDAGDNISWERIDPSKPINDNNKHVSLNLGGTPGEENSIIVPPPIINNAPNPFNLISPENGAALKAGQDINFSWETSADSDGDEVSYSLYLGCSDNFSPADLVVLGQIEKNYSYSTTKICQEYYWQIVASDGFLETLSNEIRIFTPVYSKNIIVNEVLPHPSTGINNEFIEIYNAGAEPVNIYGWFLDDIEGGSTPYQIPTKDSITDDEYWIEQGDYLVFYKTVTKLSLNDSGDAGRLLFPDGTLASSSVYTESAPIDLAWVRGPSDDWSWTEKITPGKANIIYITPETDSSSKPDTVTEDTVINSEPIEIKTGDFRDYEQKLVALEGTVISTSGNTFFVDDGSGPAKIYIQDKTGIDKPPMHKGDTFSIIGLVDLYRAVWRILPQKQSDVKLIHCVKDDQTTLAKTAKSSSAVSASKEISTGSNAANQARAPTVSDSIIKQVKAADISAVAPNSVTQTQTKNSIWGQMAKSFTSIAIIFMVLLTLKVKRIPKVKVIGGHFGDDDT